MPGFIRFFHCAQRSASGYFAFLITAAMVFVSIAPACAGQVATRILPVNSAPVRLLSCKYDPGIVMGIYGPQIHVSFANLTSHLLFNVSIRMQVYDVENTLIGSTVLSVFSDSDHPVAGNDTATGAGYGVGLSEPASAVKYATCRVEHAEFIGHRTWQYGGKKWPERLQALPADQTGYESPDAAPPAQDVRRRDVQINVLSSWNDTVQGGLFVHCALDIRGGASDATLTPNALVLTMQLANGAKKTYGAMTQAAPTYQKINPLGQTTQTAYEVDPKDDLGALGSLIVPAHGDVHITATFFVGTDVVADPAANRQVSLQ